MQQERHADGRCFKPGNPVQRTASPTQWLPSCSAGVTRYQVRETLIKYWRSNALAPLKKGAFKIPLKPGFAQIIFNGSTSIVKLTDPGQS